MLQLTLEVMVVAWSRYFWTKFWVLDLSACFPDHCVLISHLVLVMPHETLDLTDHTVLRANQHEERGTPSKNPPSCQFWAFCDVTAMTLLAHYLPTPWWSSWNAPWSCMQIWSLGSIICTQNLRQTLKGILHTVFLVWRMSY